MSENPIVKCPCIDESFWGRRKYQYGWFQKINDSKVRRYTNDDKGFYDPTSFFGGRVEYYSRWFDLSPLLGETKSVMETEYIPPLIRIFKGDDLNGWRIWGIWIKEKWFIGFSVVENVHG